MCSHLHSTIHNSNVRLIEHKAGRKIKYKRTKREDRREDETPGMKN